MPTQSKLQEAENLLQELESIEKDSIELFEAVPLVPEPHKAEDEGKVIEMYVLRWHMNDIQAVKSRELALRYEAWCQKTTPLVEKYLPYQNRAFAEVRAIMESYVTLNRYAVATARMLESANKENETGYVAVYLKEFASVVKSQANIVRSIASLPERIVLPQPRCFMTGAQCTIKLWLNPNFVFVIMPFAKEFNDAYEIGIKEVVQNMGWECARSDEIVLQRDFVLLRDFMYYYETLPLRRVEGRLSNCERVRLR